MQWDHTYVGIVQIAVPTATAHCPGKRRRASTRERHPTPGLPVDECVAEGERGGVRHRCNAVGWPPSSSPGPDSNNDPPPPAHPGAVIAVATVTRLRRRFLTWRRPSLPPSRRRPLSPMGIRRLLPLPLPGCRRGCRRGCQRRPRPPPMRKRRPCRLCQREGESRRRQAPLSTWKLLLLLLLPMWGWRPRAPLTLPWTSRR